MEAKEKNLKEGVGVGLHEENLDALLVNKVVIFSIY